MERQRPAELPNRRLALTEALLWEEQEFVVTVGFGRDGRAREIFAQPSKSNRALEATVKDAAIAVSLLLREGWPAAELLGHFAPLPIAARGEAESLVARLVGLAARLEGAARGAIELGYRAAEARP